MLYDFFNIFLPQGCLVFFIILQLILAVIVSPKYYKGAQIVSCVGLISTICMLFTVKYEPQTFGFNGTIVSDGYTAFFHFMILICGILVTLLMTNIAKEKKQNAYTMQSVLLTSILGAMSVVSSNDFLTLFISLELLSFPTYFLIASKTGYFSKEATFKYLITNAVSTGVFLLGASYLYGLTASINFSDIYQSVSTHELSIFHIVATILIVTGLVSKLGIFPFANWIIDVYKGTETSILAFMSTIPKIALFGILCRLLVFPLGSNFELVFVLCMLSLITAIWANTYAIKEKNVKAIFACSSSANMSYLIIVASLVSVYNISAAIFYLLCYLFMDIAVFAFLNITEYNSKDFNLDDFEGLFYKNKCLVTAYTISVIGLAGFPVTSGFISKIYLFSGLVHSGMLFLPILIAVLILTAVALYYYLKLITPLFKKTEESDNAVLKTLTSQKLVVYLCVVITVLIGVYPDILISLCRLIAYNI